VRRCWVVLGFVLCCVGFCGRASAATWGDIWTDVQSRGSVPNGLYWVEQYSCGGSGLGYRVWRRQDPPGGAQGNVVLGSFPFENPHKPSSVTYAGSIFLCGGSTASSTSSDYTGTFGGGSCNQPEAGCTQLANGVWNTTSTDYG
jgi:hypothetical protein